MHSESSTQLLRVQEKTNGTKGAHAKPGQSYTPTHPLTGMSCAVVLIAVTNVEVNQYSLSVQFFLFTTEETLH